MKSLIYQGVSPFSDSAACKLQPCRQEVVINLRKDGRIYRLIARDKLTPEDPYLVLVKAAAFAIQTGEAYNGTTPTRAVKDFLIKSSNVV